MKSSKLLILMTILVVALLGVMVFSSCDAIITVDSISVKCLKEGADTIEVGNFDYSAYVVEIMLSDGTVQEETLTEDMISAYDKLKLYKVGKQTLEVKYKGKTYSIDIVVKSKQQSGIMMDDLSFTYDGESHFVQVIGDIPEGAQIVYTPQQSFKDAGVYDVRATVTAPSFETIQLSCTVTISKAVYDLTGVKFEDSPVYIYDKTNKSITLQMDEGYSLPEGLTYSYTIGTTKDRYENDPAGNIAVDAGLYYISCIFAGDYKNYESTKYTRTLKDANGKEYKKTFQTAEGLRMVATLQIDKASAGYLLKTWGVDLDDLKFEDQEWNYSGISRSIQISVPDMLVPILEEHGIRAEYYCNGKLFKGAKDAGEYHVTARFVLDNTKNYEVMESKEATLTIKKVAYAMKDVTFDSLTVQYDTKAHFVEVGNLPENLTFEKYIVNGEDYNGVGYVNAGQYEVVASFIPDNNHLTPSPIKATLKINAIPFGNPIINFENKVYEYSDEGGYSLTCDDSQMPIGVTSTVTYVDLDNQVKKGFPANKKEVGTYPCTIQYSYIQNNYIGAPESVSVSASLSIVTRSFDAATLVPLQAVEKKYNASDWSYALSYSVEIPSWVSDAEDNLFIYKNGNERMQNGNVWEAGLYTYEFKFKYFNGVSYVYANTLPTRFKILGIEITERKEGNEGGKYSLEQVANFTYNGVNSCLPTFKLYFEDNEQGDYSLTYYYTEVGKEPIVVNPLAYGVVSKRAGIHKFSYSIWAYNFEPITIDVTTEVYQLPFDFIPSQWTISNDRFVSYDGEAHNLNLVEGSQSGVTCNVKLTSTLAAGITEGIDAGVYDYQVTFTATDTNYVLSNPGDTTIRVTVNKLILNWGYNPFDLYTYGTDGTYSVLGTANTTDGTINTSTSFITSSSPLIGMHQNSISDLDSNLVKVIDYSFTYCGKGVDVKYSSSNTNTMITDKGYDSVYLNLISNIVNNDFVCSKFYTGYGYSKAWISDYYVSVDDLSFNEMKDSGVYLIVYRQPKDNISFYGASGVVIRITINKLEIDSDFIPYFGEIGPDDVSATYTTIDTYQYLYKDETDEYVYPQNAISVYEVSEFVGIVPALLFHTSFANKEFSINYSSSIANEYITSHGCPNYYADLFIYFTNSITYRVFYKDALATDNVYTEDSLFTLKNLKHAGSYLIFVYPTQDNIVFYGARGLIFNVQIDQINLDRALDGAGVEFVNRYLGAETGNVHSVSTYKSNPSDHDNSANNFNSFYTNYASMLDIKSIEVGGSSSKIYYDGSRIIISLFSNLFSDPLYGDALQNITFDIISQKITSVIDTGGYALDFAFENFYTIKNRDFIYRTDKTNDAPCTDSGKYYIFANFGNDITIGGCRNYLYKFYIDPIKFYTNTSVTEKQISNYIYLDSISADYDGGTSKATFENCEEASSADEEAIINYRAKFTNHSVSETLMSSYKKYYAYIDLPGNLSTNEKKHLYVKNVQITATNPYGDTRVVYENERMTIYNLCYDTSCKLYYDVNDSVISRLGTTVGEYDISFEFEDSNIFVRRENYRKVKIHFVYESDDETFVEALGSLDSILGYRPDHDFIQEWGGYDVYYKNVSFDQRKLDFITDVSTDGTNWIKAQTSITKIPYSVDPLMVNNYAIITVYAKLNPYMYGLNKQVSKDYSIRIYPGDFNWLSEYCYQTGSGVGETAYYYERYTGGYGAAWTGDNYLDIKNSYYQIKYIYDNKRLLGGEGHNFDNYSIFVRGLYNYIYDKFNREPSTLYIAKLLGLSDSDYTSNSISVPGLEVKGYEPGEGYHIDDEMRVVAEYLIGFELDKDSTYMNVEPYWYHDGGEQSTTPTYYAKVQFYIIPRVINEEDFKASYGVYLKANGTDFTNNLLEIVMNAVVQFDTGGVKDLSGLLDGLYWENETEKAELLAQICDYKERYTVEYSSEHAQVLIPLGYGMPMKNIGQYKIELTICCLPDSIYNKYGNQNFSAMSYGSPCYESTFDIDDIDFIIDSMIVEVAPGDDASDFSSLRMNSTVGSDDLDAKAFALLESSEWYHKIITPDEYGNYIIESDLRNALVFKNGKDSTTYVSLNDLTLSSTDPYAVFVNAAGEEQPNYGDKVLKDLEFVGTYKMYFGIDLSKLPNYYYISYLGTYADSSVADVIPFEFYIVVEQLVTNT